MQNTPAIPTLAQLVERRTVVFWTSDILRSLVRIRQVGFFFLKKKKERRDSRCQNPSQNSFNNPIAQLRCPALKRCHKYSNIHNSIILLHLSLLPSIKSTMQAVQFCSKIKQTHSHNPQYYKVTTYIFTIKNHLSTIPLHHITCIPYFLSSSLKSSITPSSYPLDHGAYWLQIRPAWPSVVH